MFSCKLPVELQLYVTMRGIFCRTGFHWDSSFTELHGFTELGFTIWHDLHFCRTHSEYGMCLVQPKEGKNWDQRGMFWDWSNLVRCDKA
ncbi:hypothetical protein L596_009423 [Steinernema carpocapsae]|uniref:Uncharacterized protein n=1 Tax=Steinernema carpocapsae TaxID=34508 RepID=A0A4U5PFT0_STECR|nr:hypothetical protein L596_009423 [Steinernema carpocapsae]